MMRSERMTEETKKNQQKTEDMTEKKCVMRE